MPKVSSRRQNADEALVPYVELDHEHSRLVIAGQYAGQRATEILAELSVAGLDDVTKKQLVDRIMPETAYAPILGPGTNVGIGQI